MTDVKREEEASFYTEDKEQPIPPENVIAYNELRSCADLFRMHSSGKLEIQPDFQRDVVWKPDEQARFIDSLVKQLPIPSMCFSLDYQSQKWKVIDGLQRMHTITSFLGTAEWKIAPVNDIHASLRGKRNSQLRNGTDEEKKLYSSVEDLSIPITVIRCSYDESSHMRYLFTIFNRLNSGGVRLNSQEIRNCIYSGTFNNILKDFDKTDRNWSIIRKRIWGSMDRFRSVEILLRVLAFGTTLGKYDGNLAGFLNDTMHKYSREDVAKLQLLKASFEKMAKLSAAVLSALPSGKKSLTLVEGILVGIYSNLDRFPDDQVPVREWSGGKANAFVQLPAFSVGAHYALASEQRVKERLSQAIGLFAE
jgi:hypothetical protein